MSITANNTRFQAARGTIENEAHEREEVSILVDHLLETVFISNDLEYAQEAAQMGEFLRQVLGQSEEVLTAGMTNQVTGQLMVNYPEIYKSLADSTGFSTPGDVQGPFESEGGE